ncbi:MAG: hypothetical protein ABI832_06295 [bacterium]
MRWMSVQAWLDGQSWFDMKQYRVLGPEGLSLHWSRYLDAGIAALYSLFRVFLPQAAAEQWTLVVWPNLVFVVLLAFVATGTRRILSNTAAIFAMLAAFTWMPIRGIAFRNGRIDHHSIQIVMTTILATAMILPGRDLRRGLVAGLAAAFSLAIGLETLPVVAAAGTLLVLRFAFEAERAASRLAGFCIALSGGALVFFAGQTAPSDWLTPHCDALSTPFLAIILIASTGSSVALLLRRRLRHPAARLAVIAAIVGAGIWLAAPLLLPCLAGPYGALPLEAQYYISTRISEALPALDFAMMRPLTFANVILPVFLATALGTLFWVRNLGGRGRAEQSAIGQMLVFGWFGLLGSLIQIRMNTIAAPALPFLVGYVLVELLQRLMIQRRLAILAATIVVAIGTLLVAQLNGPQQAILNWIAGRPIAMNIEKPSLDQSCRREAILSPLNSLPKARILAPLNLGAPIILVTHHDVLAVPYQRRVEAIWNGSIAFQSEELLAAATAKGRADYIVLCNKTDYGDDFAFARDLKAGKTVSWLEPVPFGEDLRVFRVMPAALPPPD